MTVNILFGEEYMNANDNAVTQGKAAHIVFIALEVVAITAAITGLWLSQHRGPTSRILGWYVTLGIFCVPFLLLISSAMMYRQKRYLFWMGMLTVLVIFLLMILPLVSAES